MSIERRDPVKPVERQGGFRIPDLAGYKEQNLRRVYGSCKREKGRCGGPRVRQIERITIEAQPPHIVVRVHVRGAQRFFVVLIEKQAGDSSFHERVVVGRSPAGGSQLVHRTWKIRLHS